MSNQKAHCIYCDQFIFKRKRIHHNKTVNHIKNVNKFFDFSDVVEIPDYLFYEEPDYKLPKDFKKRYQIFERIRLPTSTVISIESKDHLDLEQIHVNATVNETLFNFVKLNKN